MLHIKCSIHATHAVLLNNVVVQCSTTCLFSAALQAICFKYKGMISYGITILNSSVVECLHSMQKVPGSILGWVYFLFTYYQLQHLLSDVYDALNN